MNQTADTRRKKQVTVIGDAHTTTEALQMAGEVGRALAKEGYVLITGGRGGIMEAASRGAQAENGLVIGILPSSSFEDANQYCSIVIPTGMGHARNAVTAMAGDAIIAIGGGAGTLSEICFGWLHHRPIFTFHQFGGWAAQVSGQPLDQKYRQIIIDCTSVDEMMQKLNSYFEKT